MFLLRLSFSNTFWFFSLRNLSLLKVGEEVEVDFLLALVFLDMMLKSIRTNRKNQEKKIKNNPRANCKLVQKNIEITVLYDA